MLQIRLNNGFSTETNGAVRTSQAETVTVACPDHLVIADLAVAKGIGVATPAPSVKTIGRRSRRQPGERVHICFCCDFPIAIYGRLSPCEHVFCLDCARSDSVCHICNERIQKIQTVKLKEMIFICAAPQCLKSFMTKTEFDSHIRDKHADLLGPNTENEDGNENEAQSAMRPATSDSTIRVLSRPVHTSGSSSQLHDHGDKSSKQQPRDQLPPHPVQPNPPPYFVQVQSCPAGIQTAVHQPQGFGTPQLHGTTATNANLEKNPAEARSEQGSFFGFSSGPAGYPNPAANYPQFWNAVSHSVPFEYGKNSGALPFNPPPLPLSSWGSESVRGDNPAGSRNGNGEMASLPSLHPHPPTLHR